MLSRFYAFYHTSAKIVYTFGNGPSFVMQRVMCALNHLILRACARVNVRSDFCGHTKHARTFSQVKVSVLFSPNPPHNIPTHSQTSKHAHITAIPSETPNPRHASDSNAVVSMLCEFQSFHYTTHVLHALTCA